MLARSDSGQSAEILSPSIIMPIQQAQIVVPCLQFDATFTALTTQLGFSVDAIWPADAPTTAVVSGFGVTLRLETATSSATARIVLRLITAQPPLMVPVADLAIDWVVSDKALAIPAGKQEFIITRMHDAEAWVTGRAGMQYRDLIPGRFGGRFIASHIRIPEGGAVPDYVHFHKIRFQMIFCRAGWVRVVYEDQGEPFVLHAGDCVLQPPGIRHRVLEASPGLEVIELGCPAIHETLADHQMALPNSKLRSMREFDGQRFARHVAADAPWLRWAWMGREASGLEARDTGITAATEGLAHALVVRAKDKDATTPLASHNGEFLFVFVLRGTLWLKSVSLGDHRLGAGDCVTIPAGAEVSLRAGVGAEFLEVALPA